MYTDLNEEQDVEQEEQEEQEEEEEEEVRIRGGRKRRSKEAEEAYRLKERRRALQSYYTKSEFGVFVFVKLSW